MEIEILVFLAAFLAVLIRTGLPYWKKQIEAQNSGQSVAFDQKFFYTAVLSVATSAIAGIFLLPVLLADVPEGSGITFLTFATVFGAAYMQSDIWNRLISAGIVKPEDKPAETA